MNEHLLKRFDEELNKLRYRLVRMGTLVQQQLEMSIKALVENKVEYINLVLDIEPKVDKLDMKIDKQCLRIFALHQPVAMDLRLVLSAVAMNDHLEMLADINTNIVKNLAKINLPVGAISKTKFNEIGIVLQKMASNLMDSYVYMNNDLAIETIKMTANIDKYCDENFVLLTELLKNDKTFLDISPSLIEINKDMYFISRQIKSIAEELVFLFEAKLIKHQKIDEIILSSGDDLYLNKDE